MDEDRWVKVPQIGRVVIMGGSAGVGGVYDAWRRLKARVKGDSGYDGFCRDRGLTTGALRFRMPDQGQTVVHDIIRGDVTFDHAAIEVVVGLPRSLSGGEGPAAAKVREFARALAGSLDPVPVRLCDERLSTVTAEAVLRGQGKKGQKRRAVVDQAAAVVILQNALDTERSTGRAPGELVRPPLEENLTEQQIAQPLVGVVTTWNEAAPCNIALRRQAAAAMQGVWGAGAVHPMSMTIVGDLYSLEERAKVQGYLASVWGVSSVVGPLAGGLMLLVIAITLSGLLPIAVAAIIGATLMVLTRCLSMEEAYKSIHWRSVFLVAGMLPLGAAMHRSGTAELLAGGLLTVLGPYGPWTVIAGLYFITVAGTLIIPTLVLVLLMAPIALSSSLSLGVQPQAAMMAIALAAAASNTIVKFTTRTDHPDAVVFYQMVYVTPLIAIPAFYVWTWPALDQLLLMIGVGFFATLNQRFLSRAYACADAIAVLPFEFARLPFAAIIGARPVMLQK